MTQHAKRVFPGRVRLRRFRETHGGQSDDDSARPYKKSEGYARRGSPKADDIRGTAVDGSSARPDA